MENLTKRERLNIIFGAGALTSSLIMLTALLCIALTGSITLYENSHFILYTEILFSTLFTYGFLWIYMDYIYTLKKKKVKKKIETPKLNYPI